MNNKELTSRLDQMDARIYALSVWVTSLAALHPGSGPMLLSRPAHAREQLLSLPMSDQKLALCVAALHSLSQAMQDTRLGMAHEDIRTLAPKPSGGR